MVKLAPHDVRFFMTPSELRDWFEANHASAADVWIGYHKKRSGLAGISHGQAVDEALCVGWIDSAMRPLDELTYTVRFTPRRTGSIWSVVNIGRCQVLIESGRMRPAGLAAFEARSPERSAVYSYEQAEAALTEAERDLFRSVSGAWDDFETRPPSYRRTAVHWVVSARRPDTRARRLATLITDSAAGRKIRPLANESRR